MKVESDAEVLSVKFQVYKDSMSQCLEKTKGFRTHNLYLLHSSYLKLVYSPRKNVYLLCKLSCKRETLYHVLHHLLVRPKPLPFRSPEASIEAQYEFFRNHLFIPLNELSTSTTLISYKSYSINYHTSIQHQYDQA